MKRLVEQVFKKALLAVAIVAIFGGAIALFIYGNEWTKGLGVIFIILIFFVQIITMLLILGSKKRHVYSMLSWITVIAIIPLIGLVLFLVYGRVWPWQKKKLMRHGAIAKKYGNYLKKSEKGIMERGPSEFRFAQKITGEPVFTDTHIDLINNGASFYKSLFHDVKKAKKYIHLQTFIISNGEVIEDLIDLLVEKIDEGVRVRLTGDGFGVLKLKNKHTKRLKQAGGDVSFFRPITPLSFVSSISNFRNHRKVIVIDGQVGYLGGMNIGDEYSNLSSKYGYWEDKGVRITGKGVKALNSAFASDWEFMTKETMYQPAYNIEPKPVIGNSKVITFQDNPHSGNRLMYKNVLVHTIYQAKKSITIATPYLHIPKEIINALRTAHDSGVDVKIIIPGKPDKKIVWLGTVHNAKELVSYGIKVKMVRDTFMHSKYVVVDDDIVLFGTSNFDYRAIYLHNEINSLIKSPELATKLKESHTMLFSSGVALEPYPDKSLKEKANTIYYRLFAPML